MPDAREFLELFGIEKHAVIAGSEVTSITASHEEVVPWNQYRYQIKIKFSSHSGQSVANFHRALKRHLWGIKIWTSSANRRWKCRILHAHLVDDTTLVATGWAKVTSRKAVESGEAMDPDLW